LFSFGGSAGYALGPLLAVALVSTFGLEMLWLGMIPILLFSIPLWYVLPPDPIRPKQIQLAGPRRLFSLITGPLGLLFGVSAASTFVQRAFLALQPIAVNDAGGTEALGALTLSIYLGGQALGTIAGGVLSDRMDRRRLLVGLSLLSVPAHALAIALPSGGIPALAAAAVAGFLYMAMFPTIVVMAQEQLPGGIGVSSGIVMGLAWAAAAVGVLGAGGLGDMLGARAAALLCTPVFILAAALAAHPSLKTRTSLT
jgi:FSR family fosmidomycin resistance protein-like MFS transporter